MTIQELYDFTYDIQDSKYSFVDSHNRPSACEGHQWRENADMNHFMTIPASRNL